MFYHGDSYAKDCDNCGSILNRFLWTGKKQYLDIEVSFLVKLVSSLQSIDDIGSNTGWFITRWTVFEPR